MAASSAKRTCACAACGCDAILNMKHTFCLTSDACTQNEKLGERHQRGLHLQSLSYISAHACDIWRQQPHLQTMQYLPACQRSLPSSPARSLGRSLVSPPPVAFPSSSDIGGGGADDNDELRRGGVGRWRRQGGRRAERTTATRGRRRPRSPKSHSQMRRGCAAMTGKRHY